MESGEVVDCSELCRGASPDGIISVNDEKHLVEVKCPYSAWDMTVEEAVTTIQALCLSKQGDELTLRHTHRYFYQVQVQLFVCKLSKCHFIVWTSKYFYSMPFCIDHVCFWLSNQARVILFSRVITSSNIRISVVIFPFWHSLYMHTCACIDVTLLL